MDANGFFQVNLRVSGVVATRSGGSVGRRKCDEESALGVSSEVAIIPPAAYFVVRLNVVNTGVLLFLDSFPVRFTVTRRRISASMDLLPRLRLPLILSFGISKTCCSRDYVLGFKSTFPSEHKTELICVYIVHTSLMRPQNDKRQKNGNSPAS